jgi:cyclopropane-fatty-acyl-phospholipid synthase
MQFTSLAINWSEHGLIPDCALRAGIRRLLERRLEEIRAGDCEIGAERESRFIGVMNAAPIAPVPKLANEQHYELPTEFFRLCLGSHRKYSSCYWDPKTRTLDEAEAMALAQTCQHAGLHNGQRILELGCGWGSLTLWIASHYPDSEIMAVSNSHSQRIHITEEAERRGLGNIKVVTCDMNEFEPANFGMQQPFDRILSVEMFEHMRNYRRLYARIYDWLCPEGRFFKHIFVHRLTPYAFEAQGEDDWMSRYFFSGGIIPSDDLPLRFQENLRLLQHWRWDGTHYQKTANAWLANMDANAEMLRPILEATYGPEHVEVWRNRWRIFFMSCAELFGFRNGQEWWVSHYLFERST